MSLDGASTPSYRCLQSLSEIPQIDLSPPGLHGHASLRVCHAPAAGLGHDLWRNFFAAFGRFGFSASARDLDVELFNSSEFIDDDPALLQLHTLGRRPAVEGQLPISDR
jgi:hypothetical protein